MSGQSAIKEDEFGPDLLCDPSFVPCREESCSRGDLHAEHEVMSRRGPRKLDVCPRCQTPVVVTQTRLEQKHKIEATCPSCDWAFTNSHRNK